MAEMNKKPSKPLQPAKDFKYILHAIYACSTIALMATGHWLAGLVVVIVGIITASVD